MKRLFIDTESNKNGCVELLLSHGTDTNMKNNVGNRVYAQTSFSPLTTHHSSGKFHKYNNIAFLNVEW